MKYDTLLFDVDNTLLDFDANESHSFKCLMEEKGVCYTKDLYLEYKKMNDSLWKSVERGEITIKQLLKTRFSKFMKMYGKNIDGQDYEKNYRKYLSRGIKKMPYADDVLEKLSKNYRMYIVTNGIKESQNLRINNSGLSKYFKDCFISESIGYNKPSIEFFKYVENHIDSFNIDKTLMIGDSLTSDIKGGYLAGLDTCWISKEGLINDTQITPTYQIHKLTELLEIL